MKNFFVILGSILPVFGFSQLNYPNYNDLISKINQVKSAQFTSVGHIGNSFGGEQIPVIKIQKDNKPKPTLLLVAGVDGLHPAGVINSLEVTKSLLNISADSLGRILDRNSIWIIPVANPDAYKRNTATRFWSSGNSRVIDNDRDGRIDENPITDLNADGVRSQMRVKTIAGTHKPHADYVNVLVGADRSKGERGEFILLQEGVDIDFDGKYGEDGEGGVNIDRNFTFDYPAFAPESGNYAASEPETKALMDFVYANPQISTIIQFGLVNNLSEPERYNPGKANERIVSSWSARDVDISKYVSSIYKDVTKSLGEAPKMDHVPGNFANTSYYHLGRFSFSTPTWWPSVTDSTKTATSFKGDDVFYKWVKQNNIEGAILPWTKVNHPNFPNQEVEVGGVVEIFKNNPPVEFLKESTSKHTEFITRLLSAMSELRFQEPVVTALGGDVFRVELSVTNVGMMPTSPEIADRIRHVSKLKTVCDIQKNQEFLNGKRLQLYPSLGAGKTHTFSWLIKGKGNVQIVAGSPNSGQINIEVKL